MIQLQRYAWVHRVQEEVHLTLCGVGVVQVEKWRGGGVSLYEKAILRKRKKLCGDLKNDSDLLLSKDVKIFQANYYFGCPQFNIVNTPYLFRGNMSYYTEVNIEKVSYWGVKIILLKSSDLIFQFLILKGRAKHNKQQLQTWQLIKIFFLGKNLFIW